MSEYMYETDRKAWIRLSAAPLDMAGHRDPAACPAKSRARMLRGLGTPNNWRWRLGNTKLGFVCTKQSVDGQERAGRLLLRIRSLARNSMRGLLFRAPSRSAVCSIPAAAPALPVCKPGQSRDLEKALFATTRWNM